MCSQLVNSYLPCHYKSCFEATAQQQLLDISSGSSPGTVGDNTRNRFSTTGTKHKTCCGNHKGKQFKSGGTGGINGEKSGNGAEFDEDFCKTPRNESGDCRLSMFDVFLQLSSRYKEFGFGRVGTLITLLSQQS